MVAMKVTHKYVFIQKTTVARTWRKATFKELAKKETAKETEEEKLEQWCQKAKYESS